VGNGGSAGGQGRARGAAGGSVVDAGAGARWPPIDTTDAHTITRQVTDPARRRRVVPLA